MRPSYKPTHRRLLVLTNMSITNNPPASKSNKTPAPRKIRTKPRPLNALTHGAFCKDPILVYEYWRKNNRPNSDLVDEIYNRYAKFLPMQGSLPDPRERTLRILAVKCVSRELAQAVAIKKGMVRPIRDGKTGNTRFLRIHNLLTQSLKIDAEIQKLLHDLDLLASRE